MASISSKALPFISLGIVLFAMVMGTLGYQELINTLVAALPVLSIVAGGGLINKHIEAGIKTYKDLSEDPNVKKLIEDIVAKAKQ